KPWREVAERRVLEEIGAWRDALGARFKIVEAQETGDPSLGVGWDGEKFIPQAVIDRQVFACLPLVLREEREVALAHGALGIGAWQVACKPVDASAKEIGEVGEAELAAPTRVREAVEVIPLDVRAELHRVVRRAPRQRVGELENCLVVADRRRSGRADLRDTALNRDRPEMRIEGSGG